MIMATTGATMTRRIDQPIAELPMSEDVAIP
jgi:hypothetical protein